MARPGVNRYRPSAGKRDSVLFQFIQVIHRKLMMVLKRLALVLTADGPVDVVQAICAPQPTVFGVMVR
ncbi:MAG TPA: hypothetical protein VK335_02795 [Bryobacteraceae bacterium]|nr:hypothetical protein [Bryobacteraceae bacterium]